MNIVSGKSRYVSVKSLHSEMRMSLAKRIPKDFDFREFLRGENWLLVFKVTKLSKVKGKLNLEKMSVFILKPGF